MRWVGGKAKIYLRLNERAFRSEGCGRGSGRLAGAARAPGAATRDRAPPRVASARPRPRAGRSARSPRRVCRPRLCGLELPHPLGLAGGFDKNGEAVAGLFGLGFSFVEIGTVTPRPQAGNPQPRLFRLRRQRALINRMGFNNDGLAALRARLEALGPRPGPLGANIGANRDSQRPGRGLRRRPARPLPAGRLHRGQRVVAQYAGAARAARPRAPARAAERTARRRAPASPAAPGRSRCCSRSRPIFPPRTRPPSPRSRSRSASTA